MPVEHLWQGLREDVTYHTCYQSSTELIERVHLFEHNSNPFEISDRLWVKNHLDPDEALTSNKMFHLSLRHGKAERG
jgi:hypothetical protein